MPFKSQAQRRWMYANRPAMAQRWEAHTPAKQLPARVSDAKADDKRALVTLLSKKER